MELIKKKLTKITVSMILVICMIIGIVPIGISVRTEADVVTKKVIQGAIDWGKSQSGSQEFNGYCQRFVNRCFVNGGWGSVSFASAKLCGDELIISNDVNNVPRGAVVFFDSLDHNYGHIGISLGDGTMIHAGHKGVEITRFTDASYLKSWYRIVYRGWGVWGQKKGNTIEPDVPASINICVNDSDIGSWRHNEAVSARTETNWGLYGYVNNPSGATIGQTGVYLYDAAGNLIGQKSEDYDASSNRMTMAPVFYDINKELGVTLSPGTSYKYKIFAVVGGNRVESGMVTFTTKGSSDTKPPVFEYYKIVEQDSNRYIVECKVSDENGISKVMCPTWTEKNSQDDLAANWDTNDAVKAASCGNGVYRFTVVVADHNDEHGLYHTHMYAFDSYGNSSSVGLSTMVDRAVMPKDVKTYNNSIYSVYDEGISWIQAAQYAESMNSNLVFINDADENAAVYSMIKNMYHYGYYIGARSFLEDPSKFKWCSYKGKSGNEIAYTVTDLKYSNWLPGEPNNTDGIEFYAIMPVNRQGKWNDTGTAGGINLDSGFVIETSLDINPTSTYETGTKRYEYYDVSVPYTVAEEFCEDKGGHLATITSEEENNTIYKNIPSKDWDYYVGASDIVKEGDFKWLTGEKFSYSNWDTNEPSNMYIDTAESYITIKASGKWNDLIGQFKNVGFIAEYDIQSEKPTTTTVPTKTPSVTVSPVISTPPISKPTQTPYAGYVMGDLDGDSKVSLSDVQIALKGALNIITLTDTQKKAASVISGNGQVTLQDVQMILKVALNISIF